MKKESGNKIKLGIFVVVAIVIFVVGIYYIGQKQRLFSSTIHLKSMYKDVNGLQIGNNIRFSGINVGTVDGIKIISDTTVLVTLAIDKSVQKFIKKDSKVSIGADGLMGDKNMNLIAGSEDTAMVENNDYLESVDGSTMDAIMKSIKTTADNAAVMTGDLAVVVSTIRSGKGTIGKLFMDTVLAGNLNSTMSNVKDASGSLKEDMEAAKHNFLLKGYFKKKEKDQAKKVKEEQKDEVKAEKQDKAKN
jgi:phospholipid/cholesterol/gamma-HCH transport system substrate-binding protein